MIRTVVLAGLVLMSSTLAVAGQGAERNYAAVTPQKHARNELQRLRQSVRRRFETFKIQHASGLHLMSNPGHHFASEWMKIHASRWLPQSLAIKAYADADIHTFARHVYDSRLSPGYLWHMLTGRRYKALALTSQKDWGLLSSVLPQLGDKTEVTAMVDRVEQALGLRP